MSIFVFYKISTSILNFYKIWASLSTVFIKADVGFYNTVTLRFLPMWSPTYTSTLQAWT